MSRQRRQGYLAVLAIRDFRRLWYAQVASEVGDYLARVALIILIYDRTRSGLSLSFVLVLTALPYLTVGLIVSPLVDRTDRKRLLIASDVIRALLFAGIPFVSNLGVIYLLVFVASCFSPPFEVARGTATPDIVPGDLYPLANALGSVTFQVNQVVGLAVGGVVVAAVGVRSAFFLDALTFLLSAAFITSTALSRAPMEREPWEGLGAQLRRGMQILFAKGSHLRALVIYLWITPSLVAAAEVLGVIYVRRNLHMAADTPVGLLLAAVPAGTAAGALFLGRVLPERRYRVLVTMTLLQIVAMGAVFATPKLGPAFLLWFAAGTGMSSHVLVNVVLVERIPREKRGRAWAIIQAGMVGSQTLVIAVSGPLADRIGAATAIGLAGVASVGMLTLIVGSRRSVREATTAGFATPPDAPTGDGEVLSSRLHQSAPPQR
ncbi:MAG: MFS transporter [Actinomycetota bacterium]